MIDHLESDRISGPCYVCHCETACVASGPCHLVTDDLGFKTFCGACCPECHPVFVEVQAPVGAAVVGEQIGLFG